jgi:hypothetical protein
VGGRPIYGNVALPPFVDQTLGAVHVLSYPYVTKYSERARKIHAMSCCSSILLCKHEEVITGWRSGLYNSLSDDPVSDKEANCAHQIKMLAVVSTAAVMLPFPNYAAEFRTSSQ